MFLKVLIWRSFIKYPHFLAYLIYLQSQDGKYTGGYSNHSLLLKAKTYCFIDFQKLNRIYECFFFFSFVLFFKKYFQIICLSGNNFSLDLQKHVYSSQFVYYVYFVCMSKIWLLSWTYINYPSLYPFWVFLVSIWWKALSPIIIWD